MQQFYQPTLPLVTFESVLLKGFSESVRYGFTGQPLPVGGSELSPQECQANRQRWCETLGMDYSRLISVEQCHGKSWCYCDAVDRTETDAIILHKAGIPALIQVADCTPVLLYAPSAHVGAVIHAGWRGTAQRITPEVVGVFKEKISIEAKDIIAVIGPAIGLKAYEVGQDVVDALQESLLTPHSASAFSSRLFGDKPRVDVAQVNYLQLQELGVTQIERIAVCTFSHASWLWSYRRGNTQRQGLFMQLL